MSPHPPHPDLVLYYSPKACSLASHIALEESGLAYRSVPVDVRTHANRQAEYLAINPLGAVPALAIGPEFLTESQAILTYVADRVPERGLLPAPGSLDRARAHEWMNLISSSVHATYRAAFRPEHHAGHDEDAQAAVRTQANARLGELLRLVDRRLQDKDHAVGGRFTVVDAYLFVFYLWSHDPRLLRFPGPLDAYAAHARRVAARPAVRRVLDRERAQRAYELPPDLALEHQP